MNHRIIANPNICGGEPCIRHTRIPVYVILSHLAAGEDYETILNNFPKLTKNDILSAINYASFLATEKALQK